MAWILWNCALRLAGAEGAPIERKASATSQNSGLSSASVVQHSSMSASAGAGRFSGSGAGRSPRCATAAIIWVIPAPRHGRSCTAWAHYQQRPDSPEHVYRKVSNSEGWGANNCQLFALFALIQSTPGPSQPPQYYDSEITEMWQLLARLVQMCPLNWGWDNSRQNWYRELDDTP